MTTSVTTEQQSNSSKRKIAEPDFISSHIKVVRCSEEILDNIDAALLTAEKCMEENDDTSNDSTLLPKLTSANLNKLNSLSDVSVNGKISENLSNSDQNENNEMTQNNDSNINFETDVTSESDSVCSTVHNNKQLNTILSSTSSNRRRILKATSTNNTYNNINSNSDNAVTKDIDSFSQLESNIQDTAFLTIPPSVYDKKVDASYKYLTSNDRVKSFIEDGTMFESDIVSIKNPYNPTEIDQIVDDEIIYGIHYYLVKWKKWSRGFNTWESFSDLRNSQKLLIEYARKKKNNVNIDKPINAIHLMLPRKVISKIFEIFKTGTGLSLPIISPEEMDALFNSLDVGLRINQTFRKKSLKLYLAIIALSNFRQQQLLRITNWQNDISNLSNSFKVTVENNIDLEGPPNSFVYITKCKPFDNVVIPDDPPIFCDCKKKCGSTKNCCNENINGYTSVYDVNKCIIVEPGHPVYECNKKCKCSSNCQNRVVQLGSRVSVCIYKTSNCGWGVKTTQNIKKGQFVAQYVGEVITVEESEQRLENNTSCLDYMWNLDFEDSDNFKYTIDGSHFANYTYFINHSCNPNLNLYAVWINCLDTNFPELALFAARDILAGEQLTTNYFSRSFNPDVTKNNGIKCQCNMKNCQGYFF